MKHKHSKRKRMISLLLAAVLLLGDLPLGALAQEAAEVVPSVSQEETSEATEAVKATAETEPASDTAAEREASGTEEPSGGTCGEKLFWTLDPDGCLTISGTGEMTDWSDENSVPWSAYRDQIKAVTIGEGVTSIGDYAFKQCTGLVEVVIPIGVTDVQDYAFYSCEKLSHVVFLGDAPSLKSASFYAVTATVSYPCDNPTWTDANRLSYGGTLTWKPVHSSITPTAVTPPTCTENGYTTYTCGCGDSYVDDYVETVGHSYKNGICTICKYKAPTELVITEFVNGTYASNSLTFYPNTRLRHDPISVKAGSQCSFSLPDGWSGYICLAYRDQNWDYTPKAWVQEYSYTFPSDTDAFVVMRKDDNSVISPEEYTGEILFTRIDADPDRDVHFQDYYQAEIDKTIDSVKALIGDEPCLVFPMVSDIHYLESTEVPYSFNYCVSNLKELAEEINFDFIACLGDITQGDTTQEITSAKTTHIINRFTQLGVPYYQVIGNHDDNRYGDTAFTHEQLYEHYLSTITDVVFDTSSMHKTNYYKDFDNLRIRCIFLNANTNGAYGYSEETCDWFDEVIKTEYGLIVFTHIPPVPEQNYGAGYGTDQGSTRIREACANADNFLIMFSGHNHYDSVVTEPFLSFTMNCQKFENENGDPNLWTEGAVKPQRVAGTASEDCFDIVVVRPESGRIDLIRFGAGEDRVFRIESTHTHAYEATVTAPTCTEQGFTTYTCVCGHSYRDDFTDPRPLNILMIGNSFSWDAADCGYGLTRSQTYSIMKGLVKEEFDVHLAVMYRGSSTLAYHATCAKNNSGGYTYAQIGPETGYQWDPPSGGEQPNYILDHLNSRDWDIIVVQAYQHEADGTPPSSTYVGGDAMFTEPGAAAGYLLDYFAEHEPGAKVYYYMPWASVKFYGNLGTREGYLAIAEQTAKNVVTMTGPNSGRGFAGIIPVGTAVENARTTYFHDLRYSTSGTTPPEKEVQLGLLADTQHLSLGIGRYIAGATVAQTLIPEEMRREDPELPNIKDSFSLGALPQEYSVIAQLAAEKAVETPYAVTVLPGYEEDLTTRLCRDIGAADYRSSGLTDEASVTAHVETVVRSFLTEVGNAEAEVTVHSFALEEGKIKDLDATARIRAGYTEGTAQIQVLDGKSHRFGDWITESVPTADALGIRRRVCDLCGFVQTEEVEGSWQKYALSEHLQALPEGFCSGTNLWSLLEPEEVMIDHLGNWVSAGAAVYSVTIPVAPGDKIYANSFDVTGSRKGIQVSFLGDYGIVKTTFSSGTYEEFQAHGGYLVAPEGAIAVNIPVWNVSDAGNTVHILNYDHVQEVTTVAPTCTEDGYTREGCAYCDQHSIRDVVEALGHSWTDSNAAIKECSICGHVEGGYRIDVESTEVWIDGQMQRVYSNATGTFVQLRTTEAKVLTVYSYNDATASDPHIQYPTGMQVWRLTFGNGGYTAEYMPEIENLLQYAGSSIRVTGVKGIRMITGINKGLRQKLIDGTPGLRLVEYGTVVDWAEKLSGAAPVLGSSLSNYAYRRDVADPIFADTGETVQYTNVLVGFTDDQLSSDLVMRPYLILEDSQGQRLTIYGGCIHRSIGYIAKQNQNTFPPGSSAYRYIQDILSKVSG